MKQTLSMVVKNHSAVNAPTFTATRDQNAHAHALGPHGTHHHILEYFNKGALLADYETSSANKNCQELTVFQAKLQSNSSNTHDVVVERQFATSGGRMTFNSTANQMQQISANNSLGNTKPEKPVKLKRKEMQVTSL